MTTLTYRLEKKSDGQLHVIWKNGASRPAGEIEVELWNRNRELEEAAATFAKVLPIKALESLGVALLRLEALKPDVTAKASLSTAVKTTVLASSSPPPPPGMTKERQEELKKRLMEKRRVRETSALGASSVKPTFGRLAGPAGALPG